MADGMGFTKTRYLVKGQVITYVPQLPSPCLRETAHNTIAVHLLLHVRVRRSSESGRVDHCYLILRSDQYLLMWAKSGDF